MMVLEFVLKKVEPLVTTEDFNIYSSARPKDLVILLKQESRFPNTEGARYIICKIHILTKYFRVVSCSIFFKELYYLDIILYK